MHVTECLVSLLLKSLNAANIYVNIALKVKHYALPSLITSSSTSAGDCAR